MNNLNFVILDLISLKIDPGNEKSLQITSQCLDIRTSRHPDNFKAGHMKELWEIWRETFPINYQNKYIRRGKSQKMEIHSQSRSILVNRLHNLGSTHRFVGNSHLKYRFKPVNKIPDSLKFKTWSSWLGKTRVFIFLKFKRLKFIYKMQY